MTYETYGGRLPSSLTHLSTSYKITQIGPQSRIVNGSKVPGKINTHSVPSHTGDTLVLLFLSLEPPIRRKVRSNSLGGVMKKRVFISRVVTRILDPFHSDRRFSIRFIMIAVLIVVIEVNKSNNSTVHSFKTKRNSHRVRGGPVILISSPIR